MLEVLGPAVAMWAPPVVEAIKALIITVAGRAIIQLILDRGIEAVRWGIDRVRRFWHGDPAATFSVESIVSQDMMTETDQKMIETSRTILTEQLGEKPVDAVLEMAVEERLAIIHPLITALTEAYDIPMPEIQLMSEENGVYGGYNRKNNSLVLNTVYLMSTERNDIREFLDTIFHELRHSVQNQMVKRPDFWGATREHRANLLYNFENYIRASHNPKEYFTQLVEQDAFTYAFCVMEGF